MHIIDNTQENALAAKDVYNDFIVSGLVPTFPTVATLSLALNTGILYSLGKRTSVGITNALSNTYAGSASTYVDIDSFSNIAYTTSSTVTPLSARAFEIVTAPILAPQNAAMLFSSAAGTLAAATYEYQLVAYDATGYSLPSPISSVTTSATGEITLYWTNPQFTTSISIYGRIAGSIGLLVAGLTGTSWTDNGSIVPGAAPPVAATSNAIQSVTTLLTDLALPNSTQPISITQADGRYVQQAPVIDKLLVYYGTPRYLNNYPQIQEVINEISKWNIWICGDTYENPANSTYNATVQIIQGVRANGVKVYGYVPIGDNVSPYLYTIQQITQNIIWWNTIGVDGIHLDSAGFDFAGVTRVLQIQAWEAANAFNLPVAWNAYYFEDIAADNITQVTWPTGSNIYKTFANANPNNLALPRGPEDVYIFEDFGTDQYGVNGSSGPSSSMMADINFHAKALQVVWQQPQTFNGQSSTPPSPPLAQYKVWIYVTLPFANNNQQAINYSILGNLTTDKLLFEYMWGCIYLYTSFIEKKSPFIVAACIATYNYGDRGYALDYPRVILPEMTIGGQMQDIAPLMDYNMHMATRRVNSWSTFGVRTNMAYTPTQKPTLVATTSGTLPAGTYDYQITRWTAYGESLPGVVVSITTTAVGGVKINWSNAMSGWETAVSVYGRISGQPGLLSVVYIQNAYNFVDDGSIVPGIAAPTVNQAYDFTFEYNNVFPSAALTPQAGHLPSITIVNGTTAGYFSWLQEGVASGRKTVTVALSGYENDTATAQTITFPTPFLYTPSVAVSTNTAGLTVTATTTVLTIASDSTTVFNGVIDVVGI